MQRWGIEQTFRELKDTFYFDHYQLRHKEEIMRYWMLCILAWSLVYWIKQNACLLKILSDNLTVLMNINKHSLSLPFSPPMSICQRTAQSIMITFLQLNQNDLDNIAYFTDFNKVPVFIYFERSLQEALLMKFYRALVKGRYLITEKVETILRETKEIFRQINCEAKVYQKI